MAKKNVNALIAGAHFQAFHWIFLICCLAVITLDGYDLLVYGATVPLLMKEWHINPAYAGAIGSYALFGAVLGAVVFGSLADKIGRRITIIICVAVFSIAQAMCGLVHDPITFGVLRVIAGIGIGGSLPNVGALAAEWAPASHRATLVTTVYLGMQIGGIGAAGLGLVLLPTFGWRSVYLFGAVGMILVPIFMKFMPEAPALLVAKNRSREVTATLRKVRPELALDNDVEYEVEVGTKNKVPMTAVFTDHRAFSTVLFLVIYFCALFMIYGLGIWLPGLMMKAGYPLGSSLKFMIIFNLGSIVGNLITGQIADKVGPRRLITVMYLLGFFAILLVSWKTSAAVLYVLIGLAGTCTMAVHNVLQTYVALYYPPAARSTALGLGFGLGRLGGIAGPVLGGVMLTMKFSMFQCFLGFAIPCLVNFIAILLVPDKYSYQHVSTGQSAEAAPLQRKPAIATAD
jgi:AAHS family benzoate transporter-like MFS transporter